MKEIFAKFVDAPLNTLETGSLFHKGIYYALVLIAGLTVLGGLYLTFSGLFGDYGYLKMLFNMTIFQIIRGAFASIFTIMLSLVTFIAMALIMYKRATDLNAKPYGGLLQYLHKEVFPTMIQIYGEVTAVVPIMLGLTGFFGALFATNGHSALGSVGGGLLGSIGMGDAMMMLGGGLPAIDFGSYVSILGMSLAGILGSVLMSFVILMGTYVALEVYNYIVLLITNLVKFFPRFAFPLWVQKSERGGGNIDSSDL